MGDELNFSGATPLPAAPAPRSTSYRTDRHNNPIAAAVSANSRNQFTDALDNAGIGWDYGDPFPANEGGPSMRTIRIKGDPYAASRAILSNTNALQGWYAKSTGREVLPKYNIRSNADFAALPLDKQNEVISGIYQHEGGSGTLQPTQGGLNFSGAQPLQRVVSSMSMQQVPRQPRRPSPFASVRSGVEASGSEAGAGVESAVQLGIPRRPITVRGEVVPSTRPPRLAVPSIREQVRTGRQAENALTTDPDLIEASIAEAQGKPVAPAVKARLQQARAINTRDFWNEYEATKPNVYTDSGMPSAVRAGIEPVERGIGSLAATGAGAARALNTASWGSYGSKDAADWLAAKARELKGEADVADERVPQHPATAFGGRVASGLIGGAPAILAMEAGVPAPIAFGAQSALETYGENPDASITDIAGAAGQGGLQGSLFEMPIANRFLRAGAVGAGTYTGLKAIGAPTGPSAESAVTNALFAALGARRGGGPLDVDRVGITPEGVRTGPVTESGTVDPHVVEALRRAGVAPETIARVANQPIGRTVGVAIPRPAVLPSTTIAGQPAALPTQEPEQTKGADSLGNLNTAPTGAIPTKAVEGAAPVAPDTFGEIARRAQQAAAPESTQRVEFLKQKLTEMGADDATLANTSPERLATINDTRAELERAQSSTPATSSEGGASKSVPPDKPATEDQVRLAQSPSGPETHPTVRRFLASEYKDKILKAIGADAEPLNPTELGGIKTSGVSFRKPDRSIITISDSAFVQPKVGDVSYGNKRDGFVVSIEAPAKVEGGVSVPQEAQTERAATESQARQLVNTLKWNMGKAKELSGTDAQTVIDNGINFNDWASAKSEARRHGYSLEEASRVAIDHLSGQLPTIPEAGSSFDPYRTGAAPTTPQEAPKATAEPTAPTEPTRIEDAGRTYELRNGDWWMTSGDHPIPITNASTRAELNRRAGRFADQGGFAGERTDIKQGPPGVRTGAVEDYPQKDVRDMTDAELADWKSRARGIPDYSDRRVLLNEIRQEQYDRTQVTKEEARQAKLAATEIPPTTMQQAITDANARQRYGRRTQTTEKKSYRLVWSNASSDWYVAFDAIPAGKQVSLDANEILVAGSRGTAEAVAARLPEHPLSSLAAERNPLISGRLTTPLEANTFAERLMKAHGEGLDVQDLGDIDTKWRGQEGFIGERRPIKPAPPGVRTGAVEDLPPAEREKLSPEAYADWIAHVSESVRDDIRFAENHQGYSLYEARKLMPKQGAPFRKVSDRNSGALWQDAEFVANVKGEPYILTKQEDPDAPDEFPKQFVWAFEKPGHPGSYVETATSDPAELQIQMERHAVEQATSPEETANESTEVPESTPPTSPEGATDRLTHPDPALAGRPIVARTSDGRAVVANPSNTTGISVVKERAGAPPSTPPTETLSEPTAPGQAPNALPDALDRIRQLQQDMAVLHEHPVRKAGMTTASSAGVRNFFDRLRTAVRQWAPHAEDYLDEARMAYDDGDTSKATRLAEKALATTHAAYDRESLALMGQGISAADIRALRGRSWKNVMDDIRARMRETGPPVSGGSVTYDITKYPKGGLADHQKVAYIIEPLLAKLKTDAAALIDTGKLKADQFITHIREQLQALFGAELSDWHKINQRAAFRIVLDDLKHQRYDPATQAYHAVTPPTNRFVDTAPLDFRPGATDRTTARDIRREYTGGKNSQVVIGNNIAAEGKRAVKDKLAQSAIYFYNAVGGDAAKLKSYLANPDTALDPYRKAIERALHLTPTEVAWAKTLRTGYDELGDYSYALGTIRTVKTDYHNRIYLPDKSTDFVRSEAFRTGLSKATSHAKPQVYDNVLDAVLGHLPDGNLGTPKRLATTNAFDAYSLLNQEMARANTNAKMREALTAAGLGTEVPAGKVPAGYAPLTGMDREIPISTSERLGYRRKWGWNQPNEEGAMILRKEFVVPEKIAKGLAAITDPSFVSRMKVLQQLGRYQGIVKTGKLAYSAFHHLALTHALLVQLADPATLRNLSKFREWANDATFDPLERDFTRHTGMTTRVESNQDVLRNLTQGDDLLARTTRLPIIKQALQGAELSSDFLFDKIQRHMKVLDYWNKVTGWVKNHPNATDRELVEAKRSLANEVNSAYGGLNWEAMGITKSNQALLRLTLLAPDWCVDSKTRAMTKTGWKRYDELSIGDEIMAFDPERKQLRWLPMRDQHTNEFYDGPMVRIKNYSRAIMMTPDHTCYVRNFTTGRYDVVKANQLQTNHVIPRCAPFALPTKDGPFTDKFIKLAGWFVTDGHLVRTPFKLASGEVVEYRYGKITQSKPAMVEVLKSYGLTFHTEKIPASHMHKGVEIVTNYAKHRFNIPKPIFQQMQAEGLEDGLNWNFLSQLNRRQLELLYTTMMLGDGTGQNRFCGQEQEVFYMTLIQTLLNRPTTFYQQEANCWRTRTVDACDIYTWKNPDTRTTVNYQGTIWCPSVETGFWLAEREGLVFITGNTASNILLPIKAGERSPGGAAARHHLITAAIGSALLTQGASYLLHGRSTTQNERGHEFEVEVAPGVYISLFRGGIGDAAKVYSLIQELGPSRGLLRFGYNKAAPIPKFTVGMLSNTDALGRPILVPYNPSNSWMQNTIAQLKSTGAFAATELSPLPFSVPRTLQYVTQTDKPSLVGGAAVLSGLGTATSDRGPRTDAEKYIYQLNLRKGKDIYDTGTDSEAKYQLKTNLVNKARSGGDIRTELNAAVRAGKLSADDIREVLTDSRLKRFAHTFKQLELQYALDVWPRLNADERTQAEPLLWKKVQGTLPSKSPAERAILLQKLQDAGLYKKPAGTSQTTPPPSTYIPPRRTGEPDESYRARLIQLSRARRAADLPTFVPQRKGLSAPATV